MTNDSRGRKKSNFVAQSTIAGADTLDFVTGSTNRKIAYSDFIAGLGVTGTIVQAGDPTATPVLDVAGTVNNIRNLEDGPGAKASVSPQGGITLAHNFLQDTTGSPVLINPTALQPTIASLTAGDGINLVETDEHIEISATGLESGIVLVNELSDLPAPVLKNGIMTIILEEAEYDLAVPLSSSFPLAPPIGGLRATWKSVNRAKWTYTGTDACFYDTTADGFIELFGLTEWAAPNSKMFNMDTVTGTWGIQAFGLPRFTNCKSLGFVGGGASSGGSLNTTFGTFRDFYEGLITENCFFTEHNSMFVAANESWKLDYDGQTVNFTIGEIVTGGTSGAVGIVQVDNDNGVDGNLVLSSVVGVFQNNEALTGDSTGVAVVDGVLQNVVYFTTQGTATVGIVTYKALTVFNISASHTVFDTKPEIELTVDSVNYIGNMLEGPLLGDRFTATSMDPDDDKVESSGNTFIAETRPDGLLSMQANAVATAITTQFVAELVTGTWVVERESQTTGTAGGRITYNAPLKPVTVPVDISLTVEPVSGGSTAISIYFGKAGAAVANSKRTVTTSAGNPVSITAPWQDMFVDGEFIEPFVSNDSNTINILVSSGVVRFN